MEASYGQGMRPDRPDSGTQPAPHYCEHPADMLAAEGCPRWPACVQLDADGVIVLTLKQPLSAEATEDEARQNAYDIVQRHLVEVAAERRLYAALAATAEADDAPPSTLGQDLAALAGFAAAAVIFLFAAAVLLPLFV